MQRNKLKGFTFTSSLNQEQIAPAGLSLPHLDSKHTGSECPCPTHTAKKKKEEEEEKKE